MNIKYPVNPTDYAYPVHFNPSHPYPDSCNGLTKRELFAAMFAQALMSNSYLVKECIILASKGVVKDQSEYIAVRAVESADALITALNDEL